MLLKLRTSGIYCRKRQLSSRHIKKLRLVDVKDQFTKPSKNSSTLWLHKEDVHEKVVADQHFHQEDQLIKRPGLYRARKYTIHYHSQVRDCSKTSTRNKLVGNSGPISSSPNRKIFTVVSEKLPWRSSIMYLACPRPKMPPSLCSGLKIFRIAWGKLKN